MSSVDTTTRSNEETEDVEIVCKQREASTLLNSALVFIKPHAYSSSVKDLVKRKLKSIPSLVIKCEADITGRRIDDKKILDSHYHSIAKRACTIDPAADVSTHNAESTNNFPRDKFQSFFLETYSKVVSEKRVMNAKTACERYHLSPTQLEELWRKAEQDNKVCKLGGGFYCGLIVQLPSSSNSDASPVSSIYVINGFYMSLREKFTKSNVVIHCYEVLWDAKYLSWREFRSNVIGCTDPSKAAEGSLRRQIYDK